MLPGLGISCIKFTCIALLALNENTVALYLTILVGISFIGSLCCSSSLFVTFHRRSISVSLIRIIKWSILVDAQLIVNALQYSEIRKSNKTPMKTQSFLYV